MISLKFANNFISMPDEDCTLEIVTAADHGDAEAQNDAGIMFSELENQKAAVYWWRAAAEQGHADAMHHLGRCYTGGLGVSNDENIGIMWIAKAASNGHVIAQLQMKGLRPFADWSALNLPVQY